MKKIIAFAILFSFGNIWANTQALQTVKKLVGFIRFKKNDQALSLIDTKTFSKNLLKTNWEKLSADEQNQFEDAMKNYIKNKSFPQALQYFDKIDINYGTPKSKQNLIELPGSILYKGSDKITFSWLFQEVDGKLKVTDFIDARGKLATEHFGTTKIIPAYEKKGIKELIELIKKESN